MNRIWRWLAENSSQLQGLAAVATILAALAAVPFLVTKWLQPEITIRVTPDRPTIPPSLEGWIADATTMLRALPAAPEEGIDPYASLRELQRTGPLDSVRRDGWRLGSPGRLQVDISNNADRLVSGVRVRLDRAYPTWGITLNASFLTEAETSGWQRGLSEEGEGPTIVLPELPPIPPKSAMTVTAFGDVADAEVSATVPGASFRMVPTVRLEDRWPVSLILRPNWIPFSVGLAALALLWGLAVFEKRTWQRARRIVTYNLACREAREGRPESALALLQEAVDVGYRDFQHMQKDPDLVSLQDLEVFKSLSTRSS